MKRINELNFNKNIACFPKVASNGVKYVLYK